MPEALTRLAGLRSAYLSRNPLAPESLTRLAGLQELRLLSLIECFPRWGGLLWVGSWLGDRVGGGWVVS